MALRGKKVINPNDPARFSGNGLNYRAKLIGIETVPEARGDEMCQETITKLKNSVKISGQHKPKIFVQVTLEGLKIIDAISLTGIQNKKKSDSKSPKLGENNDQDEKPKELIVLHTHAVHRISFIARDVSDNRAFGYVYGEGDGTHKFFAIKTAAAAEQLVLALRDLFQVVYEMKKKEMEKTELDIATNGDATKGENSQPSGDGSTSETGQAPQEKANADGENIYQVPTNNAPVNPPTQAEQVANLLDLEDQADHILKDIEQIKNLEFDSLTSDSLFSPASPPIKEMANLAAPSSAGVASLVDPWGLSPSVAPAAPVAPAASSSSALGDLAGLQTGPFSPMAQNPFPSSPFSMQPGLMGAPNMGMMGANLPVNRDPFGNDPFGNSSQPRMQPSSGFGGTTNPFGASGFGPQFGMPQAANIPITAGLMPGMVPHGFMPQPGLMGAGVSPMAVGGIRNPFAQSLFPSPQPQMGNLFGEEESNVLKPMKKDGSSEVQNTEANQAKSKSTRDDLFGDLLDIKKSAPAVAATLSPKDLFAQNTPVEKKSLNELKSVPKAALAASTPQVQASDNFECHLPEESRLSASDEALGPPLSDQEDEEPSASSYGPPAMDPPSCPSQLLNHPFVSSTPPPVPQRHPSPSLNFDTCLNSENKAHTRSGLYSPPIPSRTSNKSKYSHNTSLAHPLSPLSLKITRENITSLLPAPDEPPPPLPLHLTPELTAPAPPPRPTFSSSSFTSSSSSVSDINALESMDGNLKDKSGVITFNTESTTLSRGVLFLDDDRGDDSCDFDSFTPGGANVNSSDINFRQSDVWSSATFSSGTDSDNNPFPVTFAQCEENGASHNIRKVNDPFAAADSESCPFGNPTDMKDCDIIDNEESDPFNMPLHLTPGFKVVAKYGADPFDDSFNAFRNDKWDPFAEQENCVEKSDISVK